MPSVQPCMPHSRPAVRSFVVRWARPPNPYLYYLTLPAFSQAYGIPLVFIHSYRRKPPGVPTEPGHFSSYFPFLFGSGRCRFFCRIWMEFLQPNRLTYVLRTVLFQSIYPCWRGPTPCLILFYFISPFFFFFSAVYAALCYL